MGRWRGCGGRDSKAPAAGTRSRSQWLGILEVRISLRSRKHRVAAGGGSRQRRSAERWIDSQVPELTVASVSAGVSTYSLADKRR
jgi:hypothetical protein